MNPLAILPLLIVGCAAQAPVKRAVPPLPTAMEKRISPMVRIPDLGTFKPAAAGEDLGYVPFKYNSGTNYWWDVQASSNLIDWVTIFFDVGPDDITVTNTGQYRFFRIMGRPAP